ncbi:hypothetical protein [Bradyrhizobium sp. USDA 3458]|uniref:hypothetical protein n=1 Tax=Bradyrhizobium sp. USDA 3458 TaxID=2591461 RepID=UPI001FEFC388|nr:hypothetical protein [Bradyrhizobium sp. USDA 3458]
MVDMPERTLNSLPGLLQQNEGRLSKRAPDTKFSQLTPDEVTKIEQLYQADFDSGLTSLQALAEFIGVSLRDRAVGWR